MFLEGFDANALHDINKALLFAVAPVHAEATTYTWDGILAAIEEQVRP